ncbi:hypothetical protein [Streptomyces sp. NPDC020951]|uniref:hypothetical protein n=1 Tax=Streptomyces sp. NPDC020951 TaxID=3365104 RepID=UPI0037AE77C6
MAARLGLPRIPPGGPAPQIEAVRDVLADTVNPELPGVIMVSRPSDALAVKREAQIAFSGLFLGLAAVALVVGGVGVRTRTTWTTSGPGSPVCTRPV